MEIENVVSIELDESRSIEKIIEQLASVLSVEDMKEHVAVRMSRVELHEIPDSMLGAYYAFCTIINSDLPEKTLMLNEGKFVNGVFNGRELIWLEFNGWYIYADGYNEISTGKMIDVDYGVFEETSADEMYKQFFAVKVEGDNTSFKPS